MKILVADDDAVSRMLLQRMLRDTDFEVIPAKDGLDAIQTLSKEDGPRLVLLDWTMPGLSGLEVCRAIRRGLRKAYIYIALLTSKDSKQDLVAGLEAGADDYLVKPCHPEELLARLRTGRRILQLEDILVEAREEMRRNAAQDSLTKLANRGAILELLEASMNRNSIAATSFSVMMCDLDSFKLINDTYGHVVGDEVLREVADRLKETVPNGTVGRYGGEEFLILIENCDARFLTNVSKNICEAISSSPVKTSAGPLRVTISCGALPFSDHMTGLRPEEVVEEADRLLYQSKRNGRNQAVVAEVHQSAVVM